MLTSIRNRAQGWIAGVIIGLICLTFALFGVNSYLNEAGNVDVAVINGKGVSLGSYQVAYTNYRRQVQNVLGDQVDIAELNQDTLKKDALDQLIVSELLGQVGKESGMRISDAQIAASINGFEAFQREGRFAQDLYERRTRDIGLSPKGFELQMGKDLLNEQIRLGIANSNFVTTSQVEQISRIQKQNRDIGYTIISSEPYRDQVEVSDEKIEAFYKANLDDYLTEEKVKVAYIELSLDVISSTLNATDEKLKNYYESNKGDFTIAEQRSANHILIHVPNDASSEAEEEARKKAQDLVEQARAGADFEELAQKHSDDVGSKAEGGATGFFARGFMVPGFDEAVFSMQEGEISEPVKTTFGFHVIRLNAVKEGGIESFEEARDKVEAAWKQSQSQDKYFALAEELQNLSFENPDSLEPASSALGIDIKTTDYFTARGGEGLAAEGAFVAAAFSQEVLKEGLNSKPVELGENRVIVMRIDDHKPTSQLSLEQVREEVVTAYTAQAAKEMAYARGREILEELQSGSPIEDVAARNDINWEVKKDVSRSDESLNRAILRSVFKLGRPDGDKALFGGVPMGSGDFAVIAVTAIKEPAADEIKGKFKDDLRKDLAQVTNRTSWKDFVNVLRDSAKIDIFSERL